MTVPDGASAEYTFAVQHGQRGFYARVCVQVQDARPDEPDAAAKVSPDVDAQWHDVVRFGVCYAIEQANREQGTARRQVSVTEVDWQPFDSTAMAVFFATVQATWKGLGFTPRHPPRFEPSSAEFVIPN